MKEHYEGSDSIAEAREWWEKTRWETLGVCPVCEQDFKVYSHPLDVGLGRALMRMADLYPEWSKLSKVTSYKHIALLKWWRFIEQNPQRKSEWRITPDGWNFRWGGTIAPRAVLTYNSHLVGIDDSELVGIRDIMGVEWDEKEMLAPAVGRRVNEDVS